jgi:hypothetical protein
MNMTRVVESLVLLATLVGPAPLLGQDRDRANLAGLPGVYVSVHVSGRELPEGMSDEELAGDIEHGLRGSGVPVLTEDQMLKAPGAPVLQVSVVLVKATTGNNVPLGFGYAIQVEVIEGVSLDRSATERHIAATTWRRPVTVAVAPVNYTEEAVFRDVRDEIAAFVESYQEANRKG